MRRRRNISQKARKAETVAIAAETSEPPVHRLSAAEKMAAGKKLRDHVSHQAQGVWKRPSDRADPLDILHASDAGRIARLLPIRYGRMLQSPFTFYRGAAAVMAADLARTPTTGIQRPGLRRLPSC